MSDNEAPPSPGSNNDKRLTVRNTTPLPMPFVLFPDKPKFELPETPKEVYTCVYQAVKGIAGATGRKIFVIKEAASEGSDSTYLHIIAGAAMEPLREGLRCVDLFNDQTLLQVSNSRIGVSKQNSTCLMTMPRDEQPSFSKDNIDVVYKDVHNPVPDGCVRIMVDSSFTYSDNSTVPYPIL